MKIIGKIIIPDGAVPAAHEIETAAVFAASGLDVYFIAPNRSRGARTPDVTILGTEWEMKSPLGNSGRTLDDTIKRALKQSKNIIIDLGRSKMDDKSCEKVLRGNKNLVRGVKRLKLVTKSRRIIDIL